LVIDVADLDRREIKRRGMPADEAAPAAEAPIDDAIEQRAERVIATRP
jgi:hypothetical protein